MFQWQPNWVFVSANLGRPGNVRLWTTVESYQPVSWVEFQYSGHLDYFVAKLGSGYFQQLAQVVVLQKGQPLHQAHQLLLRAQCLGRVFFVWEASEEVKLMLLALHEAGPPVIS